MFEWSLRRLTLGFLISLLGCGLASTAAGFAGWLYPWLSLLLVFPLAYLIFLSGWIFRRMSSLLLWEQWLVIGLASVWALHAFNVLTPETAFDAVWYHLPIVHQLAEAHRLVYLSEYYQSLNPLFSDLIFLLGYQVGGEIGAKVIAYLFGLGLILVTYQLASLFLPRTWSLLLVSLVSTFQVVTWQSSSFYVDVAKATWELSALWLLVDDRQSARSMLLSGLFLGASLATKLFSLLLIPPMLMIVSLCQPQRYRWHRWYRSVVVLCVSGLVALPFYARTAYYTGQPLLSAGLHLSKLEEIGGHANLGSYFTQQLITLPFSVVYLTFLARDYLSFALLLLFPLLLLQLKKIMSEVRLVCMAVFAASQWLIWWFVPPVSSRYALAGFVVLATLLMISLYWWIRKHAEYFRPMILMILIAIGFNLLPRLVVFSRILPYLLGQQSRQEYLHQFRDGSIDQHLDAWAKLSKQ